MNTAAEFLPDFHLFSLLIVERVVCGSVDSQLEKSVLIVDQNYFPIFQRYIGNAQLAVIGQQNFLHLYALVEIIGQGSVKDLYSSNRDCLFSPCTHMERIMSFCAPSFPVRALKSAA